MDQHEPIRPLDCTDLQALLSGLIDDELDHEVRHLAERHLVGCATCRTLVDDAEATHQAMVAEFGAAQDDTALSVDFVGGVLSRTVYADAGASRGQLRTWTGWLVAAAALAFAATVWLIEGQGGSTSALPDRTAQANGGAPSTTVRVADGPTMRSSIYVPQSPMDQSSDESDDAPEDLLQASTVKLDVPPVVYGNEPFTMLTATAAPALDDDAVRTLYAATDLLEFLVQARTDTFQDVDHARRVIEYDDLIARLDALRPNVPAPMHGTILTVTAIFERLVHGPVAVDDIEGIRRTIDRAALPFELRTLLPLSADVI